MDALYDLLIRIAREAATSVEYGDWPELQVLVERADYVETFEESVRLATEFVSILPTSVEYGSWPELRELVEEITELLADYL